MAFRIKGPRPNEGPEYLFAYIIYYSYICIKKRNNKPQNI
nr:MAG TPA: hypothetical protein [Caudoviricetes sp.]